MEEAFGREKRRIDPDEDGVDDGCNGDEGEGWDDDGCDDVDDGCNGDGGEGWDDEGCDEDGCDDDGWDEDDTTFSLDAGRLFFVLVMVVGRLKDHRFDISTLLSLGGRNSRDSGGERKYIMDEGRRSLVRERGRREAQEDVKRFGISSPTNTGYHSKDVRPLGNSRVSPRADEDGEEGNVEDV